MAIMVRPERDGDRAAVRRVNELAFARAGEADLVDRLRDEVADDARYLSLVAEEAGAGVIGHALFTPVKLGELTGTALGPVAVIPDRQRGGIGGAMIRHGIEEMRTRGVPFVAVLGHPEYYPRFGFVPARRYGVTCTWPVPDDVFMILWLRVNNMTRGTVEYHPAFDSV